MSKNVIVIIDSNKTFVQGFSNYLSSSSSDELIVLNNLDDLNDHPYNYLLIDEEMKELLEYPDQRVFYLVDEEEINSPLHICRFKNAKQILNHLQETNEAHLNQPLGIMLFSMSGGTGKSLLATGFCNALEHLGKRTLYISYSLCNGSLHKDIDLSLLIYYIHNKQNIPDSVLQTLNETLANPSSRINAYMNTAEDRAFLDDAVIITLNTLLKKLAGDRMIIVEIPWGSGNELKAISRQVNYKILLADNRHDSQTLEHWSAYYKKEFGNEEGFYLIQNKAQNLLGEDGKYEMPIFDEQLKVRGVEEWINKYLLTQWMK